MKNQKSNLKGLFFALWAILYLFLSLSVGFAKEYRIAVVKDGPSWEDVKVSEINGELSHMLGSGQSVVFVEDERFNAQWQKNRFKEVITNALKDRSIDMILGLGVLVLQEAAKPDMQLTKPFVSATLLNGDIPKLEYSKDDYSLKKNLAVIIHPLNADRDLQVFSEVWKFKRLHVLMSREIYKYLNNLKEALTAYSKQQGVEVIPVPVDDNVEQYIGEHSPEWEAAYLLRMPRITVEKRKALIVGLTQKKIPTFSAVGVSDLELGAFATNRRDIDKEIIRRTALNIFNLIDGQSTEDLPVFLLSDPLLQINAKTAVALGYKPNFNVRVTATFLHPEAFEEESKPLYLKDVIKMAAEGNKDLQISMAKTDIAENTKDIARSYMLPQLDINGVFSYFDLPAVGNIIPERWLQLKFNLRQMIYDDQVISDYRTNDRRSEAAKYLHESNLLDIYQKSEYYFLLFTQARLIHQIQVANLRLTEGNLEIARMRVEVGSAGRDEVFRWQAELAKRKTNVLLAETLVENQRIALNQILGIDQSVKWQPEKIDVNYKSFIWLNAAFADIFETTDSVDKFTSALLKYALQASPEVSALNKEKEAQEITLGEKKRSYYLPKVKAELSYRANLDQYPEEPDFGKTGIVAGVGAYLPLFEGTRRYNNIQQQQARLKEITSQLLKTQELVEKRLRTAVRNLNSSFPNMQFSVEAAKNAKENFGLVREKYANGIVNITDLLEAQTAAFTAELQAVSARYKFLLDLVELQRAAAFFPEAKSEEEVQAFIDVIKSEMGK